MGYLQARAETSLGSDAYEGEGGEERGRVGTFFRILVVDDHDFMREGIKAILAAAGDLEVVGEAEDGLEAL
jgi:PleD family two-component response regulator